MTGLGWEPLSGTGSQPPAPPGMYGNPWENRLSKEGPFIPKNPLPEQFDHLVPVKAIPVGVQLLAANLLLGVIPDCEGMESFPWANNNKKKKNCRDITKINFQPPYFCYQNSPRKKI